MILVLTGTNPYSFSRLTRPMDKWAKENGEDVFIQLGNTEELPENCQYEHFVQQDKLKELIDNAEFVVSQGGFGSLRECIRAGKKIVAVPRYEKLNECLDNQEQVVRALEEKGLLMAIYDINDLYQALVEIQSWDSKAPDEPKIANILNDYLQRIE